MNLKSFIVGIISDTHGLLRPEAAKLLKGVNIIIHAGDIGGVEIVSMLKQIAPTKAIHGNVDNEKWADNFPETLELKILKKNIFVVHNVKDFKFKPEENKYDVIISGHSHKPSIKKENGILYLNPGSAGKRRFNLPITIAKLKIVGDEISARIIDLKV